MVQLDEWEELGIKILVLIHNGLLDFEEDEDIDLRQRVSPELYNEFDYQFDVVRDFIPNNIFEFMDEFFYYEKYGGARPLYEDGNPRYWAAARSYDAYNDRISLMKAKAESQKNGNSGGGVSGAQAVAMYNKHR